ncbi:MAG: uncharacterized protein PWP24_259 [Clostridiales bacterium]|nr:uncharacterized protein [Clostridiales bacterium]
MSMLMIVAIICAYVVKGLVGFANTLVFSSIVSFQTSNLNISPVELLVGYPANAWIAWRERHSLQKKIWLPLSITVILGSIPGAFLLKHVDASILKVIFGVVIILVGVEMLLRPYTSSKKGDSSLLLGIIGLFSGILCGLFGIGALLSAYVSRTTTDSQSFRGNMCLVFVIENTFRIFLYGATGILSLPILYTACKLLPFMGIGLLAGSLLARRLHETYVKRLVILMLILSGISLIVKTL